MGVYCIDFSPAFGGGDSTNTNGLLVATGGGDNLAKLWTVFPNGKENTRIQLRARLEYHTYMVTDLEFSADGMLLCTVSLDKTVLLWNPHSGELMQVLNGHLRFVSTCSWSPYPNRQAKNARVLATGGNDKAVFIWNIHIRGESDLIDLAELNGSSASTSQQKSVSAYDATSNGASVESDSLPDEMYCPISHEVMQDPVVAADGYSYERVSLQKWFVSSHTSPITNLPLPSLQLIPNRTLRSLIKSHLDKQQQQQKTCKK